jgi:hypothetical protein
MAELPTEIVEHIEEFVDKEVDSAAQMRSHCSATVYNELPASSKGHMHAVVTALKAEMESAGRPHVLSYFTKKEILYLLLKGFNFSMAECTLRTKIPIQLIMPPLDGQERNTWSYISMIISTSGMTAKLY